MRTVVQRFPGRSPAEIFERVRTQLWGRRREISSHELIDRILEAVKWDARRFRAGGSKRVMMVKSTVDLRVEGDELRLDLKVPLKKYEDKYAERIALVFATLFDG
jgi:hypothetical protein